MISVVRYILIDILRSKVVIAYGLLLFLMTFSMFMLDENPVKSTISLVNLNLIIIPLFSIVYSTIHYYNSYEFIQLLVAQPISRIRILLSEFIGLSSALLIAFLAGVGVPVLLFNPSSSGLSVIYSGVLTTLIFISLAFFSSVATRDKAKGIGAALLIWLFFSIMYDGIILFILFAFSDYPVETPVLIMSHLNPVDLARIFMLIKMDTSALMGYTGAVYLDYFGGTAGGLMSLGTMIIWMIFPVLIGLRIFSNKDL